MNVKLKISVGGQKVATMQLWVAGWGEGQQWGKVYIEVRTTSQLVVADASYPQVGNILTDNS